MTGLPVFVQTPRQLFNLSLAQLEVVQRPPETPAARAVVGGEWNLLSDSYELLTTYWDELLPVARLAGKLREGIDIPDSDLDKVEVFVPAKLDEESELVMAFRQASAANLDLRDAFNPDGEFRRLARSFRTDLTSAAPSVDSLWLAAKWAAFATRALAVVSDCSLASLPWLFDIDSYPNLAEGLAPPPEPPSRLAFDVEGLAWWAGVLSLESAEALTEAAARNIVTTWPTAEIDGDAFERIAESLPPQDRVAFIERFFTENAWWPYINERRATMEERSGQAVVVSVLPESLSDDELDGMVTLYAEALHATERDEQALEILSVHADSSRLERLTAEAERLNGEIHEEPFGLSSAILFQEMMALDGELNLPPRETLMILRAYVRGVLEERRRRGDELGEATLRRLDEILENQRKEKEQRENSDRQILKIRDSLERGLPASWEASMRTAFAEAAANRDWDKAAEALLRRGASGAAKERLDGRYGDKWQQLGRDSRDNLQVLEILMADYTPALSAMATHGLFRVFEPEFKVALDRRDVA